VRTRSHHLPAFHALLRVHALRACALRREAIAEGVTRRGGHEVNPDIVIVPSTHPWPPCLPKDFERVVQCACGRCSCEAERAAAMLSLAAEEVPLSSGQRTRRARAHAIAHAVAAAAARADGASGSVHSIMELLITDEKDAFLVPVPQYPLYSAALTLHGGTMLSYYLDEESNWGISIPEVQRVIQQAKDRGLRLRGMVVINPGNPTGQVRASSVLAFPVYELVCAPSSVVSCKGRRCGSMRKAAGRLPGQTSAASPAALCGRRLDPSCRTQATNGFKAATRVAMKSLGTPCHKQTRTRTRKITELALCVQCLDVPNQVELLKLCAGEGMPIVADEVYQQNVRRALAC
jgi:Aminotransferase class I and II